MLIDFRQLQGGKRGSRGGLDDDGVARGQGRPDLVGHQVEGEIKGADTQDRAQGKAPGDAQRPRLAAVESRGMTSPPTLAASSAARPRVSAPRPISARA